MDYADMRFDTICPDRINKGDTCLLGITVCPNRQASVAVYVGDCLHLGCVSNWNGSGLQED